SGWQCRADAVEILGVACTRKGELRGCNLRGRHHRQRNNQIFLRLSATSHGNDSLAIGRYSNPPEMGWENKFQNFCRSHPHIKASDMNSSKSSAIRPLFESMEPRRLFAAGALDASFAHGIANYDPGNGNLGPRPTAVLKDGSVCVAGDRTDNFIQFVRF